MKLAIATILLATAMVVGYLAMNGGWGSSARPAAPESDAGAAGAATRDVRVRAPEFSERGLRLPERAAPADAGLDEAAIDELDQIARAKQQEIEALMQEYERHIGDPDQRERLEREINALMAEYNEAVLPLATAAMERQRDG